MDFFKKLHGFLKSVSDDPRIPKRDKTVILALLILVISPIDLIPDWIPILGWLDDLVILALVLDYFFEYLDQEVLLSSFPWSLRTFIWLKKSSRIISRLAPKTLKRLIWSYKPDVYKKTSHN